MKSVVVITYSIRNEVVIYALSNWNSRYKENSI